MTTSITTASAFTPADVALAASWATNAGWKLERDESGTLGMVPSAGPAFTIGREGSRVVTVCDRKDALGNVGAVVLGDDASLRKALDNLMWLCPSRAFRGRGRSAA